MTRLRLGMVGGGEGAFIGAVHRMAAALDSAGAAPVAGSRSGRGDEELDVDVTVHRAE